MKTCSPATLADSVRRGSTKYTLPPRASMSLSRLAGLETWRKLHLEITGLAPTTIRHSVWSTSGNGCVNGKPYTWRAAANLLAQSWVADEYMLFEPSPSMKPCANTGCRTPNPAAVPTYIAIELALYADLIARTLAPIFATDCSHEKHFQV